MWQQPLRLAEGRATAGRLRGRAGCPLRGLRGPPRGEHMRPGSARRSTLRARMKRVAAIGLFALLLAACGSGLEGTLAWDGDPTLGPHSLNGSLKNTTSHSVAVNPKRMRLLDADGKK